MTHVSIDPLIETDLSDADRGAWSRIPAPSRYLADPDVPSARIQPFRTMPSPRTRLLRDFLLRPALPTAALPLSSPWGGTGADSKSSGEVLYEDFFPVHAAPGAMVLGGTAVEDRV